MTFALELLSSWSVAYVATRNLRKRIVLRRRKIAHYYIWHGTFIFDLISTLVFIIQVLPLLLEVLPEHARLAVLKLGQQRVATQLELDCKLCSM